MVNYEEAKIYQIRSYKIEKVYIGSTCQKLSMRMAGHRRSFKGYLKGKYNYVTSFEILLDLPVQFIIAIILLTAFLWYQLKSVSVPLRLEFTLILGTTYALALGTILWFLLYQDSLNLVINITAVITLLGLGTDFDIYLYTRIQEEQRETHDLEKAIHQAIKQF